MIMMNKNEDILMDQMRISDDIQIVYIYVFYLFLNKKIAHLMDINASITATEEKLDDAELDNDDDDDDNEVDLLDLFQA